MTYRNATYRTDLDGANVEDEIEITPEMARAGADVLWANPWEDFSRERIAIRVYEAMETARRLSTPDHQP